MPRWTRWFLRAAFAWLLLGFVAGSWLLSARGFGWTVPWGPLLALHLEVLLFGWMLQFTLGVAYWMLPRHATEPERGPEAPVAVAFVLLNAGVILAGAGGLLHRATGLQLLGRLSELAAVAALVRNLVPRIKPFGAGRR